MPSLFISSFYIFQQIDRQIGLRGHICHLCQFSVLVIILKCASSNSCVPPPMGAVGGRLKDRVRGTKESTGQYPVFEFLLKFLCAMREVLKMYIHIAVPVTYLHYVQISYFGCHSEIKTKRLKTV